MLPQDDSVLVYIQKEYAMLNNDYFETKLKTFSVEGLIQKRKEFEEAFDSGQNDFWFLEAIDLINQELAERRKKMEEYELIRKIGDKRFGSGCKHEKIKNGYCLNCLRKVIS